MKTLKELKKKLKGTHFSPEGGRAMYFLYHYLVIDAYYSEVSEWPLQKYFKGVGSLLKDNVAKWFFVIADDNAFIKALESYISGEKNVEEIENFIIRIRDNAVSELKDKNPQMLSDAELSVTMRNYCEYLKMIFKMASIIRIIDRGIVASINRAFSSDQSDLILRRISVNTRPSSASEEEQSLLKLAIASDSLDEDGIREGIKKISDDFCFSTLGYFHEQPKDISYYESRLSDFRKNDPKGKLTILQKKLNDEKKEKTDFVADVSNQLKIISEISGSTTFLKDYYKYSVNKIEYFYQPFLNEVARRRNLPIDDVMDCSPDELVMCATGKPIDFEAIKKRRKISVVLLYEGEMDSYTGDEASFIETTYLLPNHASATEFKGRIASTGHAKGKACVVLGPKDFHKMKKGDILVVINTSPDFVPIMHMAAAIVSEEGGLTAHVSVVSREFGIPSIVGIRGITEVIKDGDMVEVDAERGVVKIIK